jgi:hypothetical protein
MKSMTHPAFFLYRGDIELPNAGLASIDMLLCSGDCRLRCCRSSSLRRPTRAHNCYRVIVVPKKSYRPLAEQYYTQRSSVLQAAGRMRQSRCETASGQAALNGEPFIVVISHAGITVGAA